MPEHRSAVGCTRPTAPAWAPDGYRPPRLAPTPAGKL